MWGRRGSLAVAALAASLLAAIARAGSYAQGAVVATSWRGQFQGVRTVAQPLLHRHCPLFGVEKMVVVPLPKPDDVDLGLEDEYKLQLLVDHERLPTPWLRVLGPSVSGVPMVDVKVDVAGEQVVRVEARVVSLPDKHHREHRQVISEMKDAAKWPKHAVVRFTWRDVAETDAEGALFWTFLVAVVASGIVAWNSFSGYLEHFRDLMASAEAHQAKVMSMAPHARRRVARARRARSDDGYSDESSDGSWDEYDQVDEYGNGGYTGAPVHHGMDMGGGKAD